MSGLRIILSGENLSQNKLWPSLKPICLDMFITLCSIMLNIKNGKTVNVLSKALKKNKPKQQQAPNQPNHDQFNSYPYFKKNTSIWTNSP